MLNFPSRKFEIRFCFEVHSQLLEVWSVDRSSENQLPPASLPLLNSVALTRILHVVCTRLANSIATIVPIQSGRFGHAVVQPTAVPYFEGPFHLS